MKTICLFFQVHQPFRLRRFRFFDIGNDQYYYDDYLNESVVRKVASHCYLPANEIILDLIKKHQGKFRVSFSISGMALEQFELYAPEVLESFRKLAQTGQVEFLAETYAHSLASLKDREEFEMQVKMHAERMKTLFGQEPTAFRNTEHIYSDEIGAMVADMGYRVMLTEGAKHVLGWKSPNFLYANAINPKLKVLLRNFKLSDDIAFRFSNKSWSEWPLTADKFVSWINTFPPREEVLNLFMDYETFGEHQWADTGIFEFLKALPAIVFDKSTYQFSTPTEIAEKLYVVSAIHVPYPISWADEERDLTAWLGNPLQEEAFNKLYSLRDKILNLDDPGLKKDWYYLQNSDHFYYMCTKFFSDGSVHSYFNPYNSPYDAFINYMNVLSDFMIRLNAALPSTSEEKELARLYQMVREKDEVIKKYEEKIRMGARKPASGTPAQKKVSSRKKEGTGTTRKPSGKKTGEKSASDVRKKSGKKASSTGKSSGTRKKSSK
ncbi:MAG: polysaccharide deacetylase family protein [Bacteroidales bacterium]